MMLLQPHCPTMVAASLFSIPAPKRLNIRILTRQISTKIMTADVNDLDMLHHLQKQTWSIRMMRRAILFSSWLLPYPNAWKDEDRIDSESSPSDMMNTSSNSGSSRLAEDCLDCLLELGVGVLLRHSCNDDCLFLQICWHRSTNHEIKRHACKDVDKAEIEPNWTSDLNCCK